MRSEGLRVEGPEGIHIASVKATDDPAEVGPDTTIIWFQNGVLKDQYLRTALGDSHIMARSKQAWPDLPKDVPSYRAYYDAAKAWPSTSLARYDAAKAARIAERKPGRRVSRTRA